MSAILTNLKKKQYHPVYFLHGLEAYFIDQISDYVEQHVLTDAEKSFNQTLFYGKDTDAKTLVDTCSRYPMMASHQVVILKEAQAMKDLNNLQSYVEKPVPTTILVICYKHKKFDGRSKFAKAVKKNAQVFESKPLYDNQVPDWINGYLKSKQLSIDHDASLLIAEYLGTNLSKVVNELDKLALNVPKGATVNTKMVQDNIGISKDYNVFELQKALGQRNVMKANRIINYFIANPKKNPLVVVVASLYTYFSKIFMLHDLRNLSDREAAQALGVREFFLKEYKLAARNFPPHKTNEVIGVLRQYDLFSKGVDNPGTPDGELLREMVWRILH